MAGLNPKPYGFGFGFRFKVTTIFTPLQYSRPNIGKRILYGFRRVLHKLDPQDTTEKSLVQSLQNSPR